MSSGIHAGPLPKAADDDEHHVGPLHQAGPEGEHHPGPLEPAVAVAAGPTRPQRYKKGWREKRWERRRRRRFTEEVLGWILVPIIVLSGFWAVRSGLHALGTDFTSLIQGIRTAISAAGRG